MIKLILLMITFFYTYAKEPISPIPLDDKYDNKKAQIGKRLFFDTILSKDGHIACISCHDLNSGGADTDIVSIGVQNRKGIIQSPTVLNARYNFVQFWNGRAKDLKEQVNGSLTDPLEHDMNPKYIEKIINRSLKYKQSFKDVYSTTTITYEMILDAIVEFEKALITPNAKFDKFLRGEIKLSNDEQEGYELFKKYGCITCHNGINVGGNSYQKMGIFIEYGSNGVYPDRNVLTKKYRDKNVYKVPTLRNISKTAPYFHDGSTTTLKDAVIMMGLHNLGVVLPDDDVKSIVEFLRTLDGEKPSILE